ncbi:hypothetical protein B0T17DRAFT_504978 [Bombardia bombarda]|uniref:Chromo domain-containing protein n=1 Tax=Bombardia bombarda TaxID=252184 RepID=A0AA39X6N9_9PEZI|nr:hypothetical protein B0T17DRAFT_504978 [Bombardia bombarda]
MELIDPRLWIDTTSADHMESVATESLSVGKGGGNDEEAPKPTAIDEEGNIWEVELLLAKWKQGRRVLYLVKWKGFADDANTWEKRNDICAELVNKFDTDYLEYGGNHLGVELLDKRIHRGTAEYLVRWKGRPCTDDSWEKESTISRERIREFETRGEGDAMEL